MGKHFEGKLLGEGLKFGLIISRFNEFVSKKLLEGAQDALLRHGVKEEDIDIAWTPGSFEIPLVAKKLAQTKKYDAIICLAAVIRGGTPHYILLLRSPKVLLRWDWMPNYQLSMVSSLLILWNKLSSEQELRQGTRGLMRR